MKIVKEYEGVRDHPKMLRMLETIRRVKGEYGIEPRDDDVVSLTLCADIIIMTLCNIVQYACLFPRFR